MGVITLLFNLLLTDSDWLSVAFWDSSDELEEELTSWAGLAGWAELAEEADEQLEMETVAGS